MGAGFVAAGVGAEDELLLSYVVGAKYVVPAVSRGTQTVLKPFSHVENAGGAWAEQPLVRVGREKIYVLDGGRESAERLDGINTEQDVAFVQRLADGVQVNPVAGHEMA